MKTMNIPGFTADASVYKTGGYYLGHGEPNDLNGSPGAHQAVFLSQSELDGSSQLLGPWGGWWQCWHYGGCLICCSPYWCWYICRFADASQPKFKLSQ